MERTNRKNTAIFLILAVIVFAVALMAIFALAPAATATATPTAYEGGETLNLDNLQVGDIIAGAYPTVTGSTITKIRIAGGRYSFGEADEPTGTGDWQPIAANETSLVNNNGTICFHFSTYNKDFYPFDENGERSTAWIVTAIDNENGTVFFGGQSSGEQPSYDSLAVSLSEDYLNSLPWGSTSDEALEFPTEALSITPAFSYIVDDSRDYARANYIAEYPEDNRKESVTLYIRCDVGDNASTLQALFEKGENLAVTLNGSQRKSYDSDSSTGSTRYYYHHYICDFGVISISYVDRESEMDKDAYELLINIYGDGQSGGNDYSSLTVNLTEDYLSKVPWGGDAYSKELSFPTQELTIAPDIPYAENSFAYWYSADQNSPEKMIICLKEDSESHAVWQTLFDMGEDLRITFNGEELEYNNQSPNYLHEYGFSYGGFAFLYENDTYSLQIVIPRDGSQAQGGNDPQPAAHTHDGVTFETAWTSTTSLPPEAGNYYLTADVTLSSSWNVPAGETNLCLNGHGIKVTGVDSVIYIASGRTLNVYDCGDTVHYFDRDGTNLFAININETEGSGRNSFVGGYIAGGKGKDNQMHGGGVYVNGTFNLYGGNIIGNTLTASDNCGAGVYCNENSIFRMYGGSISYNYAQNAGCAIFGWKNCSIEIHGGEISYNKTNWSSGSAISFWNPAGYTVSLKLYGGSIHDNSSHGGEGAVNLVTASPTVGLKGGLIVQDNTTDSTAGNAALNVYVGTKPINIEGELSSDAKIRIRLSSGTGVLTSGWSTYMGNADPADYFYSENEAYGVYLVDGEAAILAEAPAPASHTHNDITFTAWEPATSLPTEAGNYYLTADVTLTSTWEVPAGTTNICLNGFGIKWIGETSYSGMFYVGRDVVLNLYDCGETRHYYDLDDDQILAINIDETEGVGRGSSTGGYITGGRRPYGAGGIAWVEYGTFNMYGGTMIGNTAKQGGAVYVSESGGAFNMYGGTITHNEATGGNGGAVLVNYSAAFNMYGGSVTANMASGSGGAVQLGSTCTFNMYGGSITANRAGDSGGGVYKNTNYSVIGISGKAVITDNISNNVTNNIYVCADGDTLRILDTLTDGAAIGITLGTYGKAFTSGWKTNMNGADPAEYFFSDDESYAVYLKGDEAAILEEAPPAPVSLGEGLLYVGGVDIVKADNYTVSGTGGGKAVLSETDGKLFLTLTDYVYEGPGHSNGYEGGAIDFRTGYENGLDLTIVLVGNNTITKKDDSNIDLSHGIYYASYDHSLIIDGEGTLTISFASDRSGCFKSNGIFLEPGIFVMNGGTVLSNGGTGSEESLGIYSSQSIIFNGGSFTGNGYTTYDWHSFGIYCSNITVNGGTVSASSPLENGEDDSSAFQNSSLTINAGTVIAYGKNSFSSTYNLKCGTNSTWSIFAGEDEASATEVSSINGNSKYVRIVAQSASVHTHDYSTEWTQGETTHWHACTGDGDCDAPKKDEAAHVYGNDVSETSYYVCSGCGYENEARKAEYESNQGSTVPVTLGTGVLYVGGVDIVTAENYTVNGTGGGKAVLSETDGKLFLTLTDYVYEGPGHSNGYEGGGIDYRGGGDLTILLEGNSTITKSDDNGINYSHGIYFNSNGGSLIIDGTGTLTIGFSGARQGGKSNGIFCEPGAFVMNGGTVVSNAGTGAESAGIYTDDGITFNGGNFTGKGYYTTAYESRGIYSHGTITINGGVVCGTAPLDNGDEARAFDNGTVIINGGTVTAYGKTAFQWAQYYVECGPQSSWTILAGDDEASATAVDSIPDVHYVHIVATMAPAHVHDYSADWSKDASTHWHACTGEGDCTAPKKDEAAHVYGDDISETTYYICSVCGYENQDRKDEYDAYQVTGPVTKYDLYIAGAQVTSENLSGEGWSYDPDTNTLTLDNFTYEGEGSDDSKFWRFNSVVTYAGDDDFRVVLVGENSITNTKTDYENIMAFLSTADLTIGGSGSLTLSVPGTATNMSMGLSVDGDLTVDGGTITAIGGESEWRSAGICVFGKRYIQEGGSVFVRGGNAEESYGLYALGVEQIASIGDDAGSGEEYSDGITIGAGVKKFVATGNTSAIYTEATIAFKRDATAWTDAEHAANGEALAAGTYEYEALADYKSIEVMGALPSNLIIRIKAKSSVSDTYKQAVEAQLKENEKVYGIYDVTLYRVTTENGADREDSIQPSDIDAGLMLSIKLTIPAALRGKNFKILHVHAADDVAYVDYTLKGDGKYAFVRVSKLSEFAFVALSSDLAPSGDQGGQQGQGEQPGGQGQPGGGQEQGGNTGKEEGEGQVPTIEPEPEITQKDDPTIDNWTLTPQGGTQQGGQGPSGGQGQGQSGQQGQGAGGKQGASQEPSKPAVTVALEDAEPQPGISVEVEVKTEVSEDVKESDKKTRALALQKDDEIAVVYEVKLIRSTIENGIEIKEEIQPSDIKPGTVVVINMLIPEALRGKPFRMLHVHSEEDVKEVSYTVSEDGTTATVRVDRLSEFVFVGKAASGEEEIEPNKIPDGAIAGIVIGGSLGTLLLGFIIFFLLKRRKENDAEEAATDSAPKAKKSKKQAVGQKAAVTKQESALIVAATVAGEEESVGFYRITEDDAGKCTFALFYEDGDNLSKEMGVFDGNEEAKAAIRALRAAARGAKAKNRVRHSEESVPAPKFVLDVTEKGVYYYAFLAEDGAVLLHSVQYLNEKRCLEDLKKTLVCVATDRIVDRNGEVRDDVAVSAAVLSKERTENAPAEEAIEEVAATQSVEEPAPTEVEATEAPSEAVSLKEHLAVAKATVSHGNVNKQYVADYLKRKYAGDAEVNTRGNKTKTGLPLADTHYAITEENKKCFVYVYETAGTTMLLVKVDEQYGRALAKKHPIVKRSAFPKSKSPWYSVILDDSFTSEEVEKILDDAFVSNGGKRAADDGVSLKKTLAMAKATASSDARTKKGIAEFLKDKFGEAAEINTRGNKTKTGLPLADTHYAVFEGGKRCFVYVYETEGSVALLLRLPEVYAASKSKDGQKLIRSAFPKSKDAWYSVIADDTYDEAALQELLITAYNFAK